MNAVVLPDRVYDEAARVAAANGQSIEEFVAEAVRLHVWEEAPIVLTPEQVEIVRRVRAGRVLTSEQMRDRLATDHAAWIEANPKGPFSTPTRFTKSFGRSDSMTRRVGARRRPPTTKTL